MAPKILINFQKPLFRLIPQSFYKFHEVWKLKNKENVPKPWFSVSPWLNPDSFKSNCWRNPKNALVLWLIWTVQRKAKDLVSLKYIAYTWNDLVFAGKSYKGCTSNHFSQIYSFLLISLQAKLLILFPDTSSGINSYELFLFCKNDQALKVSLHSISGFGWKKF